MSVEVDGTTLQEFKREAYTIETIALTNCPWSDGYGCNISPDTVNSTFKHPLIHLYTLALKVCTCNCESKPIFNVNLKCQMA